MSSQSPGTPERMALSQELSEFLIEFSIALHRTAMYPWGHPSLERAASTVVVRLATLLADRTSISIGVAKRQLVIEGIATDPKHPVLRSLAEKLHRHHIGALVMTRGVRTEEVISMMRLVGAEPEKEGRPLGLDDPEKLRQWEFVRLYPLTYEQLELIGNDDDEEDTEQDSRERGTRSAQLWIGLARAALATDEHSGDQRPVEVESTEAAVVAKAINEHPEAKAYDQVIVGYLLQLAQELKQEGGAGSAAVRRRLSKLIGALDEGTLQRLVEMGGDVTQRKRFVLDASEALALDAVVEIVQAAAASTNQSISSSMVRLLTKMSAFAEQGTQHMQVRADTALREQVKQLLDGWKLEDPNPDAYTRALQSLSQRPQASASTARTQFLPEPIRLVHMALEVDSVGVPFWRAVAEVLNASGIATLVMALDGVPENNRAGKALWQHLAQEDRVRDMLATEPVDFIALYRVLDRMDPRVLAPMLMQTLRDSPTRATRMGAFKRLAAMPLLALEPYLLEGLRDERWFVKRNMLALLNEANAYSEAVLPASHARHEDPRVRREALLLWMRSPLDRDRAVGVGLSDPDERAVRQAISEARRGLPDSAVPLVARRLGDVTLESDLRAQLATLLQGIRNQLALDALVRTVTAGKTLFGKTRIAAKSPEVIAALNVLSSTWSQEARAAEVLARAIKQTDPELRRAATAKRPGK